jgi:hypothetical protein
MVKEDAVREYVRLLKARDFDGIDTLIARLLKHKQLDVVNTFIGLIPVQL